MSHISTNGMSDIASQIAAAVSTLQGIVSSVRDASSEINMACETLNSYQGSKVAGSTRLDVRSTSPAFGQTEQGTQSFLMWQTWNITGTDAISSESKQIETTLSVLEDTLAAFKSEAINIDNVAVAISGMIAQIEANLGISMAGKSLAETKETIENVLYGGPLHVNRYYQQNYEDVILAEKGGITKTISSSGCGFTATAMALSYTLGKTINPRTLLENDWARQYYVFNMGMDWSFPEAAGEQYGIGKVTQTTNIEDVKNALSNQQVVISSQNEKGPFTRGGHIIILSGIDQNGNISVNDPNLDNAIGNDYNNHLFESNEIEKGANNYWLFPKPINSK